jgi:hypothetical protein
MEMLSVKVYDYLPVEHVSDFLEKAFSKDYKNELRPKYNKSYLRWMSSAQPNCAVAMLANEIVGFAMALRRTIYLNNNQFDAYYSTLIATSPNHRRLGIASKVSQKLWNASEADGVETHVNVYHLGYAGLPTQDREFKILGEIPIWGKLLIERYEINTIPGGRLVSIDGKLQLAPTAQSSQLDTHINIDKLSDTIVNSTEFSMGLDKSFVDMYMNPNHQQAATYYYEFSKSRYCVISYNTCDAIYDNNDLKLLQLQATFNSKCTDKELYMALSNVLNIGMNLKCDLVSYYDQKAIPENVLQNLQFNRTKDKFALSIRGDSEFINQFEAKQGNVYLDFI